jgi:transcription initiation factor IIF auxiliary subunit
MQPNSIIPEQLNPGVVPADITFSLKQTAALVEPEPSVEASINPEADKPRVRWSLRLQALPEQTLDDVEKVRYTLHESVPNPVRISYARSAGFPVKSCGWGVYVVKIEVYLHSGKIVTILHKLNYEDNE